MQATRIREVELYRRTDVTVAAGGTLVNARFPCSGFKKLVGAFHFTAGTPASGFPRVRQWGDQASSAGPTETSGAIPQDASQPDKTYVFDIDLRHPYVSIEYQEDAGGGTTLEEGYAKLIP